jgi:succinate dehydrogenase / fumarate reductase cytochrome b subunit
MTSLNKKFLMAVTGMFLMTFVVAHLAGNLQIFLGPEWMNGYAEHLEELPLLLWPARGFLLLTLCVHMTTGIALAVQNNAARPVRYAQSATVQASVVSRTMVFSGLAIFFFVVFHLLHFTFGKIRPEVFALVDAKGRHDVYSMVILSFQDPWIAASYLLAMFFLLAHLSHGAFSFLQTLGILRESNLPTAKKFGVGFAFLVFLGYVSIPLGVLLGWLRPLQGGSPLGS